MSEASSFGSLYPSQSEGPSIENELEAISPYDNFFARPEKNYYGNNVEDASRVPPQDETAEKSVLGAMLLSKDAFPSASEFVQGEDFYWPRHEIIFNALTELDNNNEPADVVTLKDALLKRQELDKIGGEAYLHELVGFVPTASNVDYYAEIVKEKSILRSVIEAGTKIAGMGYEQEGEIDDIVDSAQQEVFAIANENKKEDYIQLGEAIPSIAEEIETIGKNNGQLTGISTGFIDLDRLTHGLHGGQMVVVAARPGVGKSTLGLDFARAAAIDADVPTAFFSLEMGQSELVMKILAAQGKIRYSRLRSGQLTDRDWNKLGELEGTLRETPLIIDDSPNLSLSEIRTKARRLKDQTGLGLIIIDYLQLMSSNKKVENRQQEVSEFSRSLKLLAKELDVPIVALAQLNRGSEQRGDRRPQLSDLRESGAIEQDADMVFLIHREHMNDPEHPEAHTAEIIVGKNRGGPTGKIDTIFQGQYSRMMNASDQLPPGQSIDGEVVKDNTSDSNAAHSW